MRMAASRRPRQPIKLKGKSKFIGPLPASVIDAENVNPPRNRPVNEYIRRFSYHPFAGSRSAPNASAARKPGEQFSLFVYAPFDELSSSLAFHSQISRYLVQVAHGGLAPKQLHAMAFILRAWRIAS